jgi:hypothetical protein
VYFDHIDQCGGATHAVPRKGDSDEAYAWPYTRMPGVGGHGWIKDRASAERYYERHEPATATFRRRLYEREVPLAYRPGTLLLYRFDTWHRGTPLKRGAPARRVLNVVYARDDVRHITPWNVRLRLLGDAEPSAGAVSVAAEFGFCRTMYFGNEQELDRASVQRKTRLGVPPPADRYWTHELREAVRLRFPNGDWSAYTHAPKCGNE